MFENERKSVKNSRKIVKNQSKNTKSVKNSRKHEFGEIIQEKRRVQIKIIKKIRANDEAREKKSGKNTKILKKCHRTLKNSSSRFFLRNNFCSEAHFGKSVDPRTLNPRQKARLGMTLAPFLLAPPSRGDLSWTPLNLISTPLPPRKSVVDTDSDENVTLPRSTSRFPNLHMQMAKNPILTDFGPFWTFGHPPLPP